MSNTATATQALDATIRRDLEELHGQVWNTTEMVAEFDVIGFMAPWVVVVRKVDGVKGALQFTHMPRFYFKFREEL